jgi:hypothetical protein
MKELDYLKDNRKFPHLKILKSMKNLTNLWLCKHRNNFKEGLLEKSKLAQHSYEMGQRVIWYEARILENERKVRYIKYKELAHIKSLTNPSANPV